MTKIIVTFALFLSTVVFGQSQSDAFKTETIELFATFKPEIDLHAKPGLEHCEREENKKLPVISF